MNTLHTLAKSETRDINGGKTYRCKLCGRVFDSYAKVYAHVMAHILKRGFPITMPIPTFFS